MIIWFLIKNPKILKIILRLIYDLARRFFVVTFRAKFKVSRLFDSWRIVFELNLILPSLAFIYDLIEPY